MHTSLLLAAVGTCLLTALPAQETGKPAPATKKEGYTDTPQIPGQPWRVHDAERPHPKVIRPGTATTAPSDAVSLFDGRDLKAWQGEKGPAKWVVKDGAVECNRTGSISTRAKFGDCQLHIEWQTPNPPKGRSQGRSNSGVFLMGRYEVQVLDSYDNVTYADGQAGAIYGQRPPLVNASRKPGEWQTYDILFQAPRFAEGKLVTPAYVTVLHNGVLIHLNQKILGATAHKRVAKYSPHEERAPIRLQDHGNPVRFRNIWVRELHLGKPAAGEKR